MITILTPTYNRKHLLERLYISLKKQNTLNFEWLIIDDGSTDDTSALIDDFKKESIIPIHYFKKSNGGKHTALNLGFEKAKGKWLMVVDSDDYLLTDCLEHLEKVIHKLEAPYVSISFLKQYVNGEIIGEQFSNKEGTYLESIELGISGDKADLFRTEVIRNFRFPEYRNENFMAESPLFLYVGKHGVTKFINYSGYVAEYCDDGLTKNLGLNSINCLNSTLYVLSCKYKCLNKFSLKVKYASVWWRYWFVKPDYSKVKDIPIVYMPLGFCLLLKSKFRK